MNAGDRDTLAHLLGYSSISLVLATASWSSGGLVWALPLVIATVLYAVKAGREEVQNMAASAAQSNSPALADGGVEVER